MAQVNVEELEYNLSAFSGTENYYKHLLGIYYTDGVKYLAQECQAYWLINAIATVQLADKIKQNEALQYFQLWKLDINLQQQVGVLTMEADTDILIYRKLVRGIFIVLLYHSTLI